MREWTDYGPRTGPLCPERIDSIAIGIARINAGSNRWRKFIDALINPFIGLLSECGAADPSTVGSVQPFDDFGLTWANAVPLSIGERFEAVLLERDSMIGCSRFDS